MKVKIEFNTNNAAFEDSAGIETARILKSLADKTEDWQGKNEFYFLILDINGNKIGKMEVKK